MSIQDIIAVFSLTLTFGSGLVWLFTWNRHTAKKTYAAESDFKRLMSRVESYPAFIEGKIRELSLKIQEVSLKLDDIRADIQEIKARVK